MANPEHLEILKQGVEVWNRWRQADPSITPNLSSAALSSRDFVGVDLSQAYLCNVELRDAYLLGADLSSSNLRGADLSGAKSSGAYLCDANLMHANLSAIDLSNASLGNAIFIGADLSGANLQNADLRRANLGNAILISANLHNTDLRNANLMGTNFFSAVLRNTDVEQASIGGTSFGNTDLRGVKHLDSVTHRGPSSIGIETIYRSRGNAPEEFLRGCGISEDFIIYMRSLTGTAIEFYSCFISYSSNDQSFANRLYADLQARRVRCWFAPEDLKIGDKIRDRIDESIRLRDKLLLILTESSIASDWVEHEVESALEEEKQRANTILFPIRLDDAVMESSKAWAALIRRTRHIGDFTRWKEHDSYSKAFDRLLRDLKASG